MSSELPRFMRNRVIHAHPKSGYSRGEIQNPRSQAPIWNAGFCSTGSTTSGFVCTATTASNYAHVTAGRAHNSGGYALANGSNQNMGLNNTFYTSTLAQTAAGYYIIGSCP